MSSSLRFAAVTVALSSMVERVHERYRTRKARGHIDVADEVLESMAREARMEAYAAIRDAYDVGRAEGRRAALEAWGLPLEGDAGTGDTPTAPMIVCSHCGAPKRATPKP